MKLEKGTCAECAGKAVSHGLFAAGMAWVLSPEDGLNHWGKEVSARVCGELAAAEYGVVCGKDFVIVTGKQNP